MAEEFSKGNFEFIKGMYNNSKILEDLQNAENKCKINCVDAGQYLRKAMEVLCHILLNEYGIDAVDSYESPTLQEMISALNEQNKLYANCIDKCSGYKTNCKKEKTKAVSWYTYIRQLGNSCSHAHDKDYLKKHFPMSPAPNYNNVLLAFQRIHDVMKCEYHRISKKRNNLKDINIKDFDEDIMPIGGEYIMSAYEPYDKDVSHCEKEFITCYLGDRKTPQTYSIMRMYEKQGLKKILLTREIDAFIEAMQSSEEPKFDGDVVDMNLISEQSNIYSPFYIIQYKFYIKPEHLTNEVLKTFDVSEKKKLCIELAKILNKFHNLSTPIYHRNLSFDCIYICKNRDGTVSPCIIKFDCAKIISPDYGEKETVLATREDYERICTEDAIAKYRDPQIKRDIRGHIPTKNWDDANTWEKADIYSLGVLFGDILGGDTTSDSVIRGEELCSISPEYEDYAKIVDRMITQSPEDRPTAKEVLAMLKEVDA